MIIGVLYAYIYIVWVNPHSKISIHCNEFTGVIHNIKYQENRVSLEVVGIEKILVSYQVDSFPFHLGDTIKVKGVFSLPKESTLFDYPVYLKSKKIYMTMFAEDIILVKSNQNILYQMRDAIQKRILSFDTFPYLQAFVLGDSSFIEEEVRASYQKNGINHLFAISGMHVSLFANFLLMLLKKLKVTELKRYLIAIMFLLCYLFLVNFTPSALRSTTFFILMLVNQYGYFNVKPLHLMMVVFTLLLTINPYYIFHVGFQFSYIISFYLIWFHDLLNQDKKWKSLLMTSLVSFLVGLPILLYHYYEVNFLSILFNLFFVPFVSSILFPLCLLTFIIPMLEIFLKIVIWVMENFSLFCYQITFAKISFMKLPLFIYLFYFLLVTWMLIGWKYKKKGRFIWLFSCLLFHFCFPYFDSQSYLIMIDVGQGDSFLVKAPHQQGNILIDTGGKITGKSNLAKNTILPLFKALGIKKINYLILSHGDADHMGESISIVEQFPVETVIMNPGSQNDLEKKLINVLKSGQMKYYFYKLGHILRVADLKFTFLNQKDETDENRDSLCFILENKGYKILFTGDMNIYEEEQLLELGLLQEVDILKVAHHGSKGSTSSKLLEVLKPKYALIGVSSYNHFGHPSEIVLEKLKNHHVQIWQTNLHGTVQVLFDDKLVVRTLRL